MKFKDIIQGYLLTEGRTKKTSLKIAKRIFNEKCESYNLNAYKKLSTVWRTISGFDQDYGVVRPSNANDIRLSRNTQNFSNLLLSGFDNWSKYPDRQRSIICSALPSGRKSRSRYVIIPYKNSEFGVCSNFDFWQSFERLRLKAGVSGIRGLNRLIERLVNDVLSEEPEQLNFSKLKSQLEQITFDKTNHLYNPSNLKHRKIKNLIKWLSNDKSFDNLFELLKAFMDPNRNGFKLQSFSDLITTNNEDLEVWTESSALVVRGDKIEDFLNEV